MKIVIRKIQLVMWLLLVMLVLACNKTSTKDQHSHDHTETDNHNHEEEGDHDHDHPEESSNIAHLTAEQIKTVDIQLGNIERKNLTSHVKINGVLRVPNKNKANATAMFGGIVQKLNVQMGDHVRKGQVIATVANPQFIQLQEDYLSTIAQLITAEQELDRQKQLHEGNAGVLR
ncbi:hypothetical protein GWI33_010981, partial [Rhynchophorus ferrugineus]